MQESTNEHARTILATVTYPTIATTDATGKPWAAPQFMAYDMPTQTFYWCADAQSQHAKNIAQNPDAYIVAYDSMAAPGAGDGVYAQVTTQQVIDSNEQKSAFALLLEKHAGVPYWSIADIQAADSRVKLFSAKITTAWVNKDHEEDGQFLLYRQVVSL